METYYAKYNKDKDSKDWHDWPYFAGDGAVQAADGYFRILGRVDDVINVAGHRLGTKELESAAIMVEEVAEAAAVPVIDDVRGKIVEMYVALKPGVDADDEVAQKVSQTIVKEIGSIARPKNVWIVTDMPKTRSGKIMRRVIASISNFGDVGDVTTLANPEIVDEIRHHVQSEKLAHGETPRALRERRRSQLRPGEIDAQSARPSTRRRRSRPGALPLQQTRVVDELAKRGRAPRTPPEAVHAQEHSNRSGRSDLSLSERAAGASTTDTTRPRRAAPEPPRATRQRAVARPRVTPRTARRCTAGSPKLPKTRCPVSVPRNARSGNKLDPQARVHAGCEQKRSSVCAIDDCRCWCQAAASSTRPFLSKACSESRLAGHCRSS